MAEASLTGQGEGSAALLTARDMGPDATAGTPPPPTAAADGGEAGGAGGEGGSAGEPAQQQSMQLSGSEQASAAGRGLNRAAQPAAGWGPSWLVSRFSRRHGACASAGMP